MTRNLVIRLHAKLQVRYTSRWTSQYPSPELRAAAEEDWAQVLAGLSPQDLKRGLDTWRQAWPPNALEFLAACEDPHRKTAHKIASGAALLPAPKRDPEAAKKGIRLLRTAINGNAPG